MVSCGVTSMGRPSKLNDKQKAEIQRRRINGEGIRDLAKAFKVSPATISALVSERTETIKTLATTIANVEAEFDSLAVSEQVVVRSLADQLRGISDGLATAANHNAQTSARLAGMANRKAMLLGDESDDCDLKTVVALIETSNRASVIGCNLLNANKDKSVAGELTLEQLVTGGDTK